MSASLFNRGSRGVDRRGGGLGMVPIGIEKTLVRAAMDRDFRESLLADREAALTALGETLSATERSVLATIPAPALETMIDRIDLRPPRANRFLKAVAAVAFVTAAGMAPVACLLPVATGTAPEPEPTPVEDVLIEDAIAEDGAETP